MKVIKNHYVISLEDINASPCSICGTVELSKTSGANKKAEPGNYIQHEDRYIIDLGYIRIFECSVCHNLLFFRAYHTEETELIK